MAIRIIQYTSFAEKAIIDSEGCGICEQAGAEIVWPNHYSKYAHTRCYEHIRVAVSELTVTIQRLFQDAIRQEDVHRRVVKAVKAEWGRDTIIKFVEKKGIGILTSLFNTVGYRTVQIEAIKNQDAFVISQESLHHWYYREIISDYSFQNARIWRGRIDKSKEEVLNACYQSIELRNEANQKLALLLCRRFTSVIDQELSDPRFVGFLAATRRMTGKPFIQRMDIVLEFAKLHLDKILNAEDNLPA